MIDLYTWTTPNGRKPLILLEELGLPYNLKPVDIGNGAQKEPAYLELNPNGRIPAAVDEVGTDREIKIFESGAILIHFASKVARLLPHSGQARASTLSWLMFQMGGIGPMFGQLGHFKRAEEKIPYAIDRYKNEVERLVGVLDGQLGKTECLAGEYSIADIATYPWVSALNFFDMDTTQWKNVHRWVTEIAERPAVKKAMTMEMKAG